MTDIPHLKVTFDTSAVLPVLEIARDAIEALKLHAAYEALPKDRDGNNAKALAFGRFMVARDAVIGKAEAFS
jgi:hypothetical protein